MIEKIKEAVEFTISLAFNIHKLTLIYTSVFSQWLKQKEGEYYG